MRVCRFPRNIPCHIDRVVEPLYLLEACLGCKLGHIDAITLRLKMTRKTLTFVNFNYWGIAYLEPCLKSIQLLLVPNSTWWKMVCIKVEMEWHILRYEISIFWAHSVPCNGINCWCIVWAWGIDSYGNRTLPPEERTIMFNCTFDWRCSWIPFQ